MIVRLSNLLISLIVIIKDVIFNSTEEPRNFYKKRGGTEKPYE